MKKNKVIIIILATFLSFVLGGGCYYFFAWRTKVSVPESKEVSAPEDDVPEVARRDLQLFFQEIADYEQEVKAIAEKNIDRESIDKNIKILKDQGIWEELGFESEYSEYYNNFQSSRDTFKLRISELLEKVKKEKDLESFREELKKLSEEMKKKSVELAVMFADLAERIQSEVQPPVPFIATWIGLLFLAINCSVISFFILRFSQDNIPCVRDCAKCKEDVTRDKNYICLIHIFLQFLIFPLINYLFSLKMRTLREIYKHYFCNLLKLTSLALSIFILANFLIFVESSYKEYVDNRVKTQKEMVEKLEKIEKNGGDYLDLINSEMSKRKKNEQK